MIELLWMICRESIGKVCVYASRCKRTLEHHATSAEVRDGDVLTSLRPELRSWGGRLPRAGQPHARLRGRGSGMKKYSEEEDGDGHDPARKRNIWT